MPRVAVPGAGDVTLDATSYVVFAEAEHVPIDGELHCDVTDPRGATVTVTTNRGSGTCDSEFCGQSMLEFDAPRAGTYHVACEGHPFTEIAIGHGIILGIGLSVGMVGVTIFGAIPLTVVFILGVRRRRRRPHSIPYMEVVK